MSEHTDSTDSTDSEPMQPDDVLEWTPDVEESNELADNLAVTIQVLADEIDAGDTPDAGDVDGGMAGMMGGMMGPDMALSIITPLARRWAVESPEEVLAALARLHLETGALMDHHAPEADPEDLLK